MSRRPRGKLTKQIHDPAAPDIRKPKQPRVPKFKAGKKRSETRPPAERLSTAVPPLRHDSRGVPQH